MHFIDEPCSLCAQCGEQESKSGEQEHSTRAQSGEQEGKTEEQEGKSGEQEQSTRAQSGKPSRDVSDLEIF